MKLPQVKWLLEKSTFGEDTDAAVKEIEKQGMVAEVVGYRPFALDSYDQFGPDECVITAGSINLVRHIQRTRPWLPGSFSNFQNHDCQTYYAYFGKYLLNQDYIILPLAEFNRRFGDSYDNYFIRPCNGSKSFTGQIVNRNHRLKCLEEYGRPDLPIVISSPKEIGAEYRIFCTKDYPICGSQYRNNDGKLDLRAMDSRQKDGIAGIFARSILEETTWRPDPIFALDIAFLKDSDIPHLLEISSFSCSGWYDAPLAPLIREAAMLAIEEWLEHHPQEHFKNHLEKVSKEV